MRAVPSFVEEGNIVTDGDQCLVGVDTVAEKMARFGLLAS